MCSQMVFSDTAGCPQFCPNYFQADMCVDCLNKKHALAGATAKQVRGAHNTQCCCKNVNFPQNSVFLQSHGCKV